MKHKVKDCNDCPLCAPMMSGTYCDHPKLKKHPDDYGKNIKEVGLDSELVHPDWCPLKKKSITIKLTKKL
jgi:hypothetical protein